VPVVASALRYQCARSTEHSAWCRKRTRFNGALRRRCVQQLAPASNEACAWPTHRPQALCHVSTSHSADAYLDNSILCAVSGFAW
jgi:hypothetical protein